MDETTAATPAAPVVEVPAQSAGASTAATSVVTETPSAEVAAVGKPKVKVEKSTNLIGTIASEVESLSKIKALHEAERLGETVETSYFKLGGVLKLIQDNSWFEGFESFDKYVYETFGFMPRKAAYLMQIYTDLVTKAIPWEKVSHLGWTKLKDLSGTLTVENVDEWVAKAEKLTVLELQAALKAAPGEEGKPSGKSTDEMVKLKYNVKADQAETITKAIEKARGEVGTDFDTVALENICAGYLAGNSALTGSGTFDPATADLAQIVAARGMNDVLQAVANAYPQYNITVEEVKAEAAETDAAATDTPATA